MSRISRLAEEMRQGFAALDLHMAKLDMEVTRLDSSITKHEAELAVRHLDVMSKLNILIDAVAGIRADLDEHRADGHGGEL
jgi:hypothetical protein